MPDDKNNFYNVYSLQLKVVQKFHLILLGTWLALSRWLAYVPFFCKTIKAQVFTFNVEIPPIMIGYLRQKDFLLP